MEQNKKQGRTLQDYAHLFLSRNQDREKPDTTPQKTRATEIISADEQELPGSRTAAEDAAAHSAAASPAEELINQPPAAAVEKLPKTPYAIALCCPDRPLANSFLTFNLCIDCARQGLQVLLINADLSFPSMNYLASLQPQAMKIIADRPASSRVRDLQRLQVFTLDMDITVLHSPWADEQNPIIEEISAGARTADIVLINTALGFSANAKALFKSADETIVISGAEPSQLINAYSTLKLIYQIAPQPCISILMIGPDDAALRGFMKMQEAAQQFLGRTLTSCGSFPWDADVSNSILQKKVLPGDCAAAQRLREVSRLILEKNPRQQQSGTREPGFTEKLFVTSGQAMGVKQDADRQQRWSR